MYAYRISAYSYEDWINIEYTHKKKFTDEEFHTIIQDIVESVLPELMQSMIDRNIPCEHTMRSFKNFEAWTIHTEQAYVELDWESLFGSDFQQFHDKLSEAGFTRLQYAGDFFVSSTRSIASIEPECGLHPSNQGHCFSCPDEDITTAHQGEFIQRMRDKYKGTKWKLPEGIRKELF
jgi:hypothetical protein